MRTSRTAGTLGVLAMGLSLGLMGVQAQQPAETDASPGAAAPRRRVAAPVQAAPAPAPAFIEESIDASALRHEFQALLRQHPPSLSTVLRADPALVGDAGYLATYPDVARFVARYPQIVRDTRYYVGEMDRPFDAQSAVADIWQNVVEAFAVLTGMVIVFGTAAWLLRTVIDHRRWLRASRVQVEVHQKVLDRLATNDDLLRYIQTPVGQRFLDSAPIALDAPARAGAVSAPVNRMLWSVQIGIVLAAAGMGLQWVGRHAIPEAAQFLSFTGVMALTLGVGFVASAGVAYLLSRRLGLLDAARRPGASSGGEPGL